jgi:hypothetical protein
MKKEKCESRREFVARHLLCWGCQGKSKYGQGACDLEPLGQGLKLCKSRVKKRCKSNLAHLTISKCAN